MSCEKNGRPDEIHARTPKQVPEFGPEFWPEGCPKFLLRKKKGV